MKIKILFIVLLQLFSLSVFAGQIYHLGSDRTIEIDEKIENDIYIVRIKDSEGPSERSQYPLWESGRKVLPGEVRNDRGWNHDPTPERLRQLNTYIQEHQLDSPEWGYVKPGKSPWYGHAVFARDLPKPPVYKIEEYGKPITIEIRSDSLDQWEKLAYLREESWVLAEPILKKLIRKKRDSLINLVSKDQQKHVDLSESERVLDQKFILNSYLHNDQVLETNHGSHRSLDLLIDKEEFQERLASGNYQAPMGIQRNYSDVVKDPSLIVVHAHLKYGGCTIQGELDPLIAQFKKLNLPVFYLMAGESQAKIRVNGELKDHPLTWKTTDRCPTAAIYSEYGHHSLKLAASSIVVSGANWSQCHESAILDAIQNHMSYSKEPFTIHIPASTVTGMPGKGGRMIHDISLGESIQNLSKSEVMERLVQRDFIKSIVQRQGALMGTRSDLEKDYHLNFWLDGEELGTMGKGEFEVNIKIWRKELPSQF